MTRHLVAIVAVLALTACTSEVEKLERQKRTMQQAGATERELCEQSRKIVAAALEADDRYGERKNQTDIECFYVDHPSLSR